MLAELYHRLHNNLQIVISLIRRTEKALQHSADRQHLASLRQRIQALIALQERFYRSKDFRRVDFSGFLDELIHAVAALAEGSMRFAATLAPLSLPLDKAVPFGLLANELLTQAARLAGVRDQEGDLKVALTLEAGRAMLAVEVPRPERTEAAAATARLFDLHLAERLAVQMDGAISQEDTPTGITYRVSLPL